MKITNKHNLDPAIYNVVARVYPPKPNRFSVTDMCNYPLVRVLKERHWEELEQDASEMIWMLLGSAVHYVLEKGAPEESLAEEKLTVEIDGATVVGKADIWENEEVSDYKVTSVYSFLLGDKPEWEIQPNLCAYLYRDKGFPVSRLKITAILRDWSMTKAQFEEGYPKIAFITKKIPVWGNDRAEEYMRAWIATYRKIAAQKTITEKERCTPTQRWEKPTTYAVMQKDRKRALRVLDSHEDADGWIAKRIESNKKLDGKLSVTVRPGESTKCKSFCLVRDVCPVNPYRENNSK